MVVVMEEEDYHNRRYDYEEEKEGKDKEEKRGVTKNESINSYIPPTSTKVPPFF